MNFHWLNQGVADFNGDGFFPADELYAEYGHAGVQPEMIKGLRSIITLSLQCLEAIFRHGHIQAACDRDSLVQDSDPYVEGLLRMIGRGNSTGG